jgi:hypothetical protein
MWRFANDMMITRPAWLAALCFVAAPASAQQRQTFGGASFIPPAGWSADVRPMMQSYSRIRAEHRCMVLISASEPGRRTPDESFGAVWSAVFNPGAYRRADRPRSTEAVTPSGSRHVVGEGELEDRSGNRFIARLHVFPIDTEMQSIVLLGSSRIALDACRDDWSSFFASLRFSSRAQVAASTGASAPPTAPPAPRPDPRADPLDRTPQRFENMTFVPPARWAVGREGGIVRLSPTDTRGMEALQVILLAGRRFSGAFATELDAAWSEVRSLLGAELMLTVNRVPYDVEQPTRSLRGTEYARATGGMRLADGTYTITMYVFRAGDRAERVAVASRDFRDNVLMMTTSNNPAFSRAIREVVFTLRFANEPERSLTPAGLAPGGIVGVWAGLAMSMAEIKTNFAIFFDNGLAYFGPKFPVQGLLGIDPLVEQPAQLREWGTYTMSGESGVLTMPYGTIPLRRVGAAMELTTNRTVHRFVRLAMPDSPLDGTWCMRGGQCLRLTADGRFDDAGVARAVEHSTYAFPSTPSGGQGRYALRSHTLVLTYDSGTELRVGFAGLVPDQRAPSPRDLRLGFEADVLTRR